MRTQPNNIEAEKSILGCILLDPDIISEINLTVNDFYFKAHSTIYEAIKELENKNTPIDIFTVENALGSKADAVGGLEYLGELINVLYHTANYKHYAKIVKDKSILRQAIKTATEIINNCLEEMEVEEVLSRAEVDILSINSMNTSSNIVNVKDCMVESLNNLEKRTNNKNPICGLSTGFRDLDFKLAGLQDSDLIILAARPAMGKTSLAINIAENVGITQQIPVAVFSLEMSKVQLTDRILCSQAEVDSHRYKTGTLTDIDWKKLKYPMSYCSDSALYIDDTATVKVTDIAAKCRKLKKEKGLRLVIIDYLQLITGDKKREKTQEVTEISRQLKIMAKELNVPVIALSQLSRACEQRGDKRPCLSDLRESGAIEQDADIVMFLYRDEYYNPKTEKQGIAECIISKHRSGGTGTVELLWKDQFTKFANIPYMR